MEMFYVMILVVGHKSLSNLSSIRLYTLQLVNFTTCKLFLHKDDPPKKNRIFTERLRRWLIDR